MAVVLAVSFLIAPMQLVFAEEAEAPVQETSSSAETTRAADESLLESESGAETQAQEGEVQEGDAAEPDEGEGNGLLDGGTPDPVEHFEDARTPRHSATTVDVDESMGAFQYVIPIITPPGRNGIEPDISLIYNNQNDKNEFFGPGWSINIPYIERINRHGVETMFTDDIFSSSLDGELIASTTASSTSMNVGSSNLLSKAAVTLLSLVFGAPLNAHAAELPPEQEENLTTRGWNFTSRPHTVDIAEGGGVTVLQRETTFRQKWENYYHEGQWTPISDIPKETEGGFVFDQAPFVLTLPKYADETVTLSVTAEWDIFAKTPIADPPLHTTISPPASAGHVEGHLETGTLILRNGPHNDVTYIVYNDALGEGIDLIYYFDWGAAPRFHEIKRFTEKPTVFDYAFEWAYDTPVTFTVGSTTWNGEQSFQVPEGEGVKVTMQGTTMRGSGFKHFQMWDSNTDWLTGSPTETPRHIDDISLTISASTTNTYVLTKHLSETFFDEATYPVYTDSTSTFYPDPHTETTTTDGRVQSSGSTSWDPVHDATTGTYAGDSTTVEEAAGVGRSGTTDQYFVDRGFFYFDTSSLLETEGVSSSTFSIYAESKTNDDNDGDDWLTVVQVQGDDVSNDTGISTTDIEHNGDAVDNSSEGIAVANRKDITSISTGAYVDFDLNSMGRGWIARGAEEDPSGATAGITYLGVREGHDVIDSAFVRPGGSTAFSRLQTRFADYTGTASDPKLTVISGDTSCTATTTRVYEARVENGSFNYYDFDGCVWAMTDKRGTVYTFGSTTDERLVDPEDGQRVFRWMLQEVRDRNGNFMTFEYAKDLRQVYPYKITYTHNGATEDGIFEVEFTKTWRPDTATTTTSGFSVKNNYKITQIQTKVDGDWVRKYDLTYATSSKNKSLLLSSITETGRDALQNTVSLPATTFTYYDGHTPNWSADTSYATSTYIWFVEENSSGFTADHGSRVVDVNQDGLADFHYNRGGGNDAMYVNQGDKSWADDVDYTLPQQFVFDENDYALRHLELNGDGIPDLIWGHTGISHYARLGQSDGSGWPDTAADDIFDPPMIITAWDGPHEGDQGVRIGDVNGDGLDDLVQAWTDGAGSTTQKVWINGGEDEGFVYDADYVVPTFFVNQAGATTDRGARLVDLNKDGLADIIQDVGDVLGTTHKVWINRGDGTGWGEEAAWYPLPHAFMTNSQDQGVQIADVTNDGYPDIVVSITNSTYTNHRRVHINNGDGTWTETTPSSLPIDFINNGIDQGVRLADVNGDGVIDLVEGRREYPSTNVKNVYINDGDPVFDDSINHPDLLKFVRSAKGEETTIAYKTTPMYRDGGDNLLNTRLPLVLKTVSAISVHDDLGQTGTTTYSFGGGDYYFASSTERRFSGFATTTITDPAGNVTKMYFHQGNETLSTIGEVAEDFSKIGKLYRTEEYDDDDNLFRKTIDRWDRTELYTDRDFVRKTRSVASSYDGDSDRRDTAVEYNYSTDFGNLISEDRYGEVTGSDDGTFTDTGSDLRSTAYAYAASTTTRVLGLPKSSTTTDSASTTKAIKKFYYDELSLGGVDEGNLTKGESWVSGTTYIDTERTYNAYGLPTELKDPRDKITTLVYDADTLYVSTSTDPVSLVTVYTYDYSGGQVATTTAPNGRQFATFYDPFDRPKKEIVPDPSAPSTFVVKKEYDYTDTLGSRRVKETMHLNNATSTEKYTYLNGQDRPVQERHELENGSYAARDFSYDLRGLLKYEPLPYQSSGTSRTASTTTAALLSTHLYDALSRISTSTNAAGTTIRAYDQWVATTTDPLGNLKALANDAFGNLVRVNEENSGAIYVTTYAYDTLDRLSTTTDASANIRRFTYDGLSRLTKSEDLHDAADAGFGTTTYAYDAAGNLTLRTDAKNQSVQFTYDDINRVLTEDYLGGAGTEIQYQYDWCAEGEGRLCSATTTDVVTKYAYDALGNVSAETRVIDAQTYETAYTHDRLGNQTSITYPDSALVQYIYNTAGQFESMRYRATPATTTWISILRDVDYHVSGQETYKQFGNDAETNFTYDADELYRLENIQTIAPSTTAMEAGGGGLLEMLAKGATKLLSKTASLVAMAVFGAPATAYAAEIGDEWERDLKVGSGIELTLEQEAELTKKHWNSTSKPYTVDRRKEDGALEVSKYETTIRQKWENYYKDGAWHPISAEGRATKDGFSFTNAPLTFMAPLYADEPIIFSVSTGFDIFTYMPIMAKAFTATITPPTFATHTEGTLERGDLILRNGLHKDVEYVLYENALGDGVDLIYYFDFGTAPRFHEIKRFTKKPTNFDYRFTWEYADPVDFSVAGAAWNEESILSVPHGLGVYVAMEGETMRGSGFKSFKIWDSDMSWQTGSPSETPRHIADISVSISKPFKDFNTYSITKHLPPSFFDTATYPVYTDTTSTIYPDPHAETNTVDGRVQSSGSTNWNTVHDATNGTYAGDSTTVEEAAGVGQSGTTDQFFIDRGFFYFDTGSVSNTDVINSATLSLYVDSTTNDDNDGDDFLTVVQVQGDEVGSDTAIATNDIEWNGDAIDNPTEGIAVGDREDISGIASDAYLSFPLNSTGCSWIARSGEQRPTGATSGITYLGAREGHDVIDSAFVRPGASTAFNRVQVRFADYTGTGNDPKLVIVHGEGGAICADDDASVNRTIQNISFSYDAVGNIATTTDISHNGAGRVTGYTYDDLYRLLSASTTQASSTPFLQTYTYDPLGNITNKSDVGSYTYGETGYANPHAATSVGGATLTYDNNGNVTAIGSLDYTWDWRNRLASAERMGGGNTTYGYDHTGQRTFKATGTATTSYPSKYFNLATTTGAATTTKHIFAPDGTLLATVVGSGVGTATTTYLHADHLGGTNVTTDADGEVTQTLDYYPFGAERINQGSNSTDRHYIGERYDSAEDLNYLNARYYRGTQGQFLSQDLVFLAVGDPGKVRQLTQVNLKELLTDPQALNSYSYARNNPITLKDPEGEFFKKGQLAYELVRGAFGGYGNIQTVAEFNMLIDQLTADGNWSPSDGRRLGVFISKGILEYVCDFVCDLVRAGADINSLHTRTPSQTVSGGGSGSILQPYQVVTGPTNEFGLPTFLFVPPPPPPPPPPPSAPRSSSGSGGSGSSSPLSGPRGLPPPPPPPPPPIFR